MVKETRVKGSGLEEKDSLVVVYVFCVNENILSRNSWTFCLRDSCVGNLQCVFFVNVFHLVHHYVYSSILNE
jgi:hypothetical protein